MVFNKYTSLPSVPYKIISYLAQNNDNIFKALYYQGSDALSQPNLTLEQKIDMIYVDEGKEADKHIFLKPLIGEEMIDSVTADIKNVSCDVFSGLLVDFAKQNNASVIIKGLRTVTDFEYEFQMALLNKALDAEFETVFMMTDSKYSYISSSMVKEVAKYHGELDGFVPASIKEKIMKKF